MNSDERIIKYIENELTPEEKIEFELDLKSSAELRIELEDYLNVKSRIQESKSVTLNQDYLDKIIPEFRDESSSAKAFSKKRNLGYAFVMITVIIFSSIIFKNIFTNKTQINSIEDFTESLNQEQKIQLLENLNGDLEDYSLINENIINLELTNLIETNLVVDNNIAETYEINYPELVDGLNEVEAEKIYEEILNKNFSEVEL